MNKKHYQLFAMSILLGAPLLVMVTSETLPGIKDAATAASSSPTAPTPAPQAPVLDPVDALPPSLPPPPADTAVQKGPQANAGFDAAPTLNPAGIDPTAAVGGNPAASAPAVTLPGDNPGGGLTEDQMIERQMKAQGR